MLLSLILIFVFGYTGYCIFNYLRIPGGAIAGSLVTIAIITSQGFEWVEMPSYFITSLQVIIGITIGCRFKKQHLKTIRSYLAPSLISSVWMIFISLIVGYFLAKITGIELGSALYGSVPAGLSEMGLIALSLNLCAPIVTLLQFVRYLSISLTVPTIVSFCKNNCNVKEEKEYKKRKNKDYKRKAAKRKYEKIDFKNILQVLKVILLGSVGGFTAKYFNIPVGGMLGSLFVVGVLNIVGIPLKELPYWLIRVTQILIGGYLGTSFLPEIFIALKSLLLPILFFSLFVVLNGIFLGLIFCRILKWDLATALLATSPGGVTLMTLTAMEMNADPIKVSIVQTIRIVLILLIMPTLILYIINCTNFESSLHFSN